MYALPEMGAASLRDGDEGTIVMVVLYAHDARVQRYSPPWKGAAPTGMYVLSEVGAASLRDGEQYPGNEISRNQFFCRVGTYDAVCGVMPDAVDAIYRVPTGFSALQRHCSDRRRAVRCAGTKKSPGTLRGFQGGDYLLFRFRSTIGVIRFNFSVRNGKRWSPYALITLIS